MAVGTNDPSISDHLKAFIQREGGPLVAGIIGEGSSRELTALWESPFENDTPGSQFAKAGGIVQVLSDRTSKSSLNTTQVWSGTTPHNFTIVLELYAVANPKAEVQDAVVELEKCAAPELNAHIPGGRIPPTVSLNAGKQIIYPECVITSVSRDLGGPISHDGYPLRGSVTVQLQTQTTVNQTDIADTFG